MKHKDVILFGCGNTLTQYIGGFARYNNICFASDNDSLKWGKKIEFDNVSIEIKEPRILQNSDIDIYVLSLKWEEIVEQLHQMGCRKVHSPFADHPLPGDMSFCQDLFHLIMKNPSFYFGQRTDLDSEAYLRRVYRNWNDHFRLHGMIGNAVNKGYLKKNNEYRILDYGFGVGTLGLSALVRGYDFYGVDVDTEKHAVLTKKIKELGYPLEWIDRFIIYDGTRLPFNDGYFDAVFTWQVLEHVENVDESVSELLRVCKPDGFAYLHCPNYDRSYEEHYLLDLMKPLRGNKDEFKELVRSVGADDSGVDLINFINKKDILEAIHKAGDYTVVDLREDDPMADVDYIVRRN